MGIRVDPLGTLDQRAVDLGHFPAHRTEQLGHGFHGLDRAEDVALLQRPTDLRQLEVDDVAQLFLRILGDADARVGAVEANPLVVFRVLQIRWIHQV
jgi:hypothetical protein